jgi:undecaprenyl-diphosphatase
MLATLDPLQAAVLGAVQGLTEFLPISSSAHLYVIPTLLGWPYAGVAFDVALHWGTLFALLVAFGDVWWNLARDLVAGTADRRRDAIALASRLVVGSIPAAIVGVLLQDIVETRMRSLPLQAVMLLVFGALLWAVDRFRPAGRPQTLPGWGATLGVGVAQAFALVPGVSRSGITMTAGRAAGLDRVSAARFSFLLATPITFGAGLLELRHLPQDLPVATLLIGVVSAALVGLLAIRGLLRWLAWTGFGAFFLYRAALALLIFLRLPHAG